MKRNFVAITLLAAICVTVNAQRRPSFNFDLNFTTDFENPITSVKNQYRSGTCWVFSAMGFFESEAIRINNIKDTLKYPDFSEFFVVSHSYYERAVKYVRLDGKLGFSAGSEAEDVNHVIRDFGIVPQSAMSGMNYGSELPEQSELDAVLKAYVDAVVKNPNGKLSSAWSRGLQAVLDEYLGKCPETFVVDGKEYTPASYRDSFGINPDDYVALTSFTHHPFYSRFVLEICDNWRWDESYNVPVDELMEALDAALEAGYTVAWGADVSHAGFTRDGYAIYVDADATSKAGSDHDRWVGADNGEPEPISYVEKVPTQESRQAEFDDKTMTDDHGMQIFGVARDQYGNKFYKVKNSWGITGKFDGIWYASEAYVKAQTLDLTMHKDALPKSLRKALKIK